MISLVLSLALGASPLPDAVRAMGFSQADWETLDRGGVVNRVETEKTSSGSTRAHSESGVVIRRPFKDCFEEVERYEGLSKYLPGLSESKVLERGPSSFRAHAATSVLWLTYGYGLRFEVDREHGQLRWTLDASQPHDIADTQGSWSFVPLDDKTTLLHYVMRADSGSALPQSIQNYGTERTLPQMLLAFRDHLQRSHP